MSATSCVNCKTYFVNHFEHVDTAQQARYALITGAACSALAVLFVSMCYAVHPAYASLSTVQLVIFGSYLATAGMALFLTKFLQSVTEWKQEIPTLE